MSRELTILFIHHQLNELTVRRYGHLTRLNPGVPIVPLTHGAPGAVFPSTYDSARVAGWENLDGWANTDLSIYGWFRHAREARTTSQRYVVVEYDMIYRTPMREFYKEVWDEDMAAAQLFYAGPHGYWNYFPECIGLLPPELRPFAAAVSPLAGVMLAHRTLVAIAAQEIPPGVYCECRIATLANALGFDMVEFPYAKKRNNTWHPDFVRWDKDTELYHPVKELTAMDMVIDMSWDGSGAKAPGQSPRARRLG